MTVGSAAILLFLVMDPLGNIPFFLASLTVFAILKATIGIRVKPDQELDGLDIHEHGVYGYPDLVATDHQNGNGSRVSDPVQRQAGGAA